MALTETVIKFHGCDLLMRRGGKGPAVLFLHGAGGTNVLSVPFYEKLAEQFDVLVPDHPGYGRSSTPTWLEELPDLAYFYLDLIEHLGLRQVHLIGHSMGGWLSMEIAIRSCERLKSLILMSSVGIRIKGKPVANLFILDPPQLMNLLYADKKIVDRLLAVTPTPEQLDEIVKNRATSARLAWHPRFFNPKLEKWLGRVRLPTHIIWGAQDGLVSADYAKRLAELIPGAGVTVFDKVGHVPQYEHMEATAKVMTDFIRKHT
jgi:pimeloyl-ACP methyl ester carboxylesterase